MEKSLFDSAVAKLKAAGVQYYVAYCRGGNYELRHNGKDSFIVPADEFVIHLKHRSANESLSPYDRYEIDLVPYDNIDYIYPLEVDYTEAVAILNSFGAMNDDIEKFLKSSGRKFRPNTNSRHLSDGDFLDKDGKVTENMSGRSAYIIDADADRRAEQAKLGEGEEKNVPKKDWHEVVKEKDNPE